ncbi:hypothetical protein EDB19DRAFT_1629184, partial [Suillus lakei]
RSQKFLNTAKAARPTPNMNAADKAGAQKIPRSARFAPCDATASTPIPTQPTDASVDQLDEASQELGIDVNDGGIYLTFDPDWRSSRGEAVLTFLSPIPDETQNSLLIRRRRSLNEAQFGQWSVMPRDTSTRARMHPINELQSFLCVEN